MTEALDYPSKTQLVHLDWHWNDAILGNPSATARRIYYNTNSAPDVWFDGTQHVLGAGDSVSAYNTYKPFFTSHYADPSQLLVTIDLDLNTTTMQGTATVDVEVAPGETIALPANCKIRAALYEDNCYLNGNLEPQTGNTHQSYIGRLMISETTLTASLSGETQQVVQTFAINPAWKPGDLHAVAFVQRDTNKAILQAGFSPVQYGVTLSDLDEPIERVDSGPMDFDSQVIYTGTVDDDVVLTIDKSTLPAGWDAEIVWNATSYPTTVTIPGMTQDQIEAIVVRVTPSAAGVGTVGFNVHPASLPGAAMIRSYTTFFQKPRILFVDDDNGAAFETNFENAIAGASYFNLRHTVSASGTPGASTMSHFDIVIWNTGELQTLTIAAAPQAEIISYLNGGGKFFLVSQGFINDRGLPPMMTSYFHVNGRTLDVGAPNVVGVAADPIGDGLSFAITPPFLDKSDAITTTSGGIPWLDSGVNHVGMRYDSGVFKTVFMSAPFEGVAAPNDALLMKRVIEWFVPDTITDVNPVGVLATSGLTLWQNTPNPFGNATAVKFAVPTGGHVGLTVFDVTGRRVCDLVDRRLEAGVHSIDWDGRDASGARVASGVYLVRLMSAGETVSREMVRVK